MGEDLLALMQEAHEELEIKAPLDLDSVKLTLIRTIQGSAFGIALVDLTTKKLQGILIAYAGGSIWSPEPTATIALCYLREDRRDDEHLEQLLQPCVRWAKRSGAKKIILEVDEDLEAALPNLPAAWREESRVIGLELGE